MPGRGDVREAQMTATEPSSTPQSLVPNVTIARIVYILYFVSYFTFGFTAVIGVIAAHVQVDSADPMLATHYRFQFRTFWIGLLYLVGVILPMSFIGTKHLSRIEETLSLMAVAVLFWWFIWSLIRSIKGVVALNKRRPIADPGSWLFG
jgi:uncharacterized membrane protein